MSSPWKNLDKLQLNKEQLNILQEALNKIINTNLINDSVLNNIDCSTTSNDGYNVKDENACNSENIYSSEVNVDVEATKKQYQYNENISSKSSKDLNVESCNTKKASTSSVHNNLKRENVNLDKHIKKRSAKKQGRSGGKLTKFMEKLKIKNLNTKEYKILSEVGHYFNLAILFLKQTFKVLKNVFFLLECFILMVTILALIVLWFLFINLLNFAFVFFVLALAWCSINFIEYENNSEVDQAVQTLNGTEFNGSQLKVMHGESQPTTGNNMQNGTENSWGSRSSAPVSRIPKEDRPFSDQFGDMAIGEFKSDACRRCGEVGHYAKECVNAAGPNGSAQAVTYIPPLPPETETEIFEIGSNQGINFEKYRHIPIELTGNNRPKPIQSFYEANLHPVCLKNIDLAKYKEPTPIQKYAIPAILAKRDVMACAQTGSGKTASFLLPIITNLMNEGLENTESCSDEAVLPLAAILAPTRELVVQLFTEARKFSHNSPLKPAVIYGGVSVAYQADRLRMGCHLIVATPGQLEDFIKRGKVSFRNLKYLILDEADKMIDMGFGLQIEHIIEFSGMPPKGVRNTLMFSATFPDQIQQLAAQFLNDYLFLTVGRVGGTCTDVYQTVVQVSGKEKRNTLENLLQTAGTDRTLVFVEKKRDADFLANLLSQKNFPATSLNADRSQEEREAALKDFRNGNAPILVATAVAARGLDINDVKHVINYDLPNDANEYVHRIGRTGRIGNKGKATSFFDVDRDGKLARSLVKLLSDAEQDVPDWLESCALSAIGTGYGPDGSQFRDQRIRPDQNGNSNKKFPNGSVATKAAVVNDEDEEW